MPYDLQPNPIYDRPLYDTIQEPALSYKPEQLLPPLPSTGESMYSESPTISRKRQETTHYDALNEHQKEMEDCYIQMQACNRQ